MEGFQTPLPQDTDNGDSNIKKFKKLPRGAFLPKLSIDPQIPLKMIERDMKDLRRFNHIELRDSLLVRLVLHCNMVSVTLQHG